MGRQVGEYQLDLAQRPLLAKAIRRVFEEGAEMRLELDFVARNGKEIPVLLRGTRVHCNGGEYVFGIQPMRQMIEAGSVDIVMIDLVRVGGITDWLKVAAMAEAHNLPVVSHIMPEISAQLVAAVPNGLTVEYISWGAALFEETAPVVKGILTLPDKPGLGLRFNQDVLKRYRVA